MAFKEIITQKKFINYKECVKGQHLVTGKLVNTQPNKFGNGNVDWIFETGEGEPNTVLNHTGNIKYMFNQEGVTFGDVLEIYYDGTEKLSKGSYKGVDCHTFKIRVDKEDRVVPPVQKYAFTEVVRNETPTQKTIEGIVAATRSLSKAPNAIEIEDLD